MFVYYCRLAGMSPSTVMSKSLLLCIIPSSFLLFSSCLLCLVVVKRVNWVSTETSVSLRLPLLPGLTKTRPVRAWEHNYNISPGFDLTCMMMMVMTVQLGIKAVMIMTMFNVYTTQTVCFLTLVFIFLQVCSFCVHIIVTCAIIVTVSVV